MRKETFTLKWKKECRWYSKEMNRRNFHDLMGAIRTQFYMNNEISTQLSRVMSNVDEIEIDMDRNMDMDVPIITYVTGEERKTIKVGRNHKIMWGILEECCQLE